jgi:dihydroorotase
VIQHAEDHALTEGAQMHEGAISARLGLRGWPRVAEDIIVARDVLLAEARRALPRRPHLHASARCASCARRRPRASR